MGQRKLTREELKTVLNARDWLRRAFAFAGTNHMNASLDQLCDIANNGTTDGRPYVEPQPEIGEGYRRVTEADKWRRDRELYDPAAAAWVPAKLSGVHLDSVTYRVPIDRTPTDEDTKQRPIVMVRDGDAEPWQQWRLIAVANRHHSFITLSPDSTRVVAWGQCRFPYPGELD